MAALTLWIPSKKFAHSILLDETRKLDSEELKRRAISVETWFSSIKELSEQINKAFGDMVLFYMLEWVLSCSFSMHIIIQEIRLQHPDWKRLIYYVFHASQSHCTFLISAKISSQVACHFKINMSM